MLDTKLLRNQFSQVKEKIGKRGESASDLEQFPPMDEKRRKWIQQVEKLKSRRNTVSEEIAVLKREKKDAQPMIEEMQKVNGQIKALDGQIKELETDLQEMLLTVPNVPHDSVPPGDSEDDNEQVKTWGELPSFSFKPKSHWEIGEHLGILNFEAATRVTGSRFVFLQGMGSRLERALIHYMLDQHDDNGYLEMMPPHLVHRHSMVGTGQLPKFEEDAFKVGDTDYFLIPTAEVPLVNYHRQQILDGEELPIAYSAYSACFRSEAGSAGRDTRGLIRQHQFNKVELVRFVKPEESYSQLEQMSTQVEGILQQLGLPYRMVSLCGGDLGFSAAKTYDFEVWLPSFDTYREISSVSNCEDFQARRANIRFRRETKGRPEFVHTLNGSGLAIGRTVAAILENYQQEDGRVRIPEVLRPYMRNREYIE